MRKNNGAFLFFSKTNPNDIGMDFFNKDIKRLLQAEVFSKENEIEEKKINTQIMNPMTVELDIGKEDAEKIIKQDKDVSSLAQHVKKINEESVIFNEKNKKFKSRFN